MSIFPEDKHLEVYMKSNKEPDKSPSPTTIIFISLFLSIPISAAFSVTLFEELFGIENTFDFHFDGLVDSNYPINPPLEPPENVENNGSFSVEEIDYGIPFDSYRIAITPSCNGVNVIGADFRIKPSASDSVIQGIVLSDQWVSLTGITTYENGVIWYQAVNESELKPSTNPNANNQLFELQLGWIQDCFVREAGYPP